MRLGRLDSPIHPRIGRNLEAVIRERVHLLARLFRKWKWILGPRFTVHSQLETNLGAAMEMNLRRFYLWTRRRASLAHSQMEINLRTVIRALEDSLDRFIRDAQYPPGMNQRLRDS